MVSTRRIEPPEMDMALVACGHGWDGASDAACSVQRRMWVGGVSSRGGGYGRRRPEPRFVEVLGRWERRIGSPFD
ncbi:Os08g0459366 [Oryza sativa Japonica Group]|uniref:Os08g0459366 protein n=1 Tax=Oryza sativa subsp. japonica TaxID=39947 RepID=A0A0P0XGF3_ORYSJ|nr:Os08g0459366 [Oryza sativa Japonica Group]